MPIPKKAESSLLAPCGINCMPCYKYGTDNKSCPGCFMDDGNKPKAAGFEPASPLKNAISALPL